MDVHCLFRKTLELGVVGTLGERETGISGNEADRMHWNSSQRAQYAFLKNLCLCSIRKTFIRHYEISGILLGTGLGKMTKAWFLPFRRLKHLGR